MDFRVKVGSVIQANESAGEWCGCNCVVTEVKPNSIVLAAIKIPYKGIAYIRLTGEQFEYIGESYFLYE